MHQPHHVLACQIDQDHGVAVETIDVRELRLNLSRHLRSVKDGKDIIVTERGRPIAKITPVIKDAEDIQIRTTLSELAQKGMIQVPENLGKPTRIPRRVELSGSPLSDAVIENRR